MNKLFVSLACALSLGYLATAAPMKTSLASYNQGINIIPQPKELVQGKGSFTLTAYSLGTRATSSRAAPAVSRS